MMTGTRLPAVAGAFYPDTPARLSTMVARMLDAEEEAEVPRILIAPHAGYVYSGPVAGAGFARVGRPSRVILLGVSHRHRFEHVAASGMARWQTPLGTVDVDRTMTDALVDASPLFTIDDDVHRQEHGLEVELPFLQTMLEDFRIVPLLLGGEQDDLVQRVSAVLAARMDETTLLLVSSDLSHYPTQADAERIDRATIRAILSLDPAQFKQAISNPAGIPGLATRACGAAAIRVALHIARRLGMTHARLFDYRNSGDMGGDPQSVVGYASIGVF